MPCLPATPYCEGRDGRPPVTRHRYLAILRQRSWSMARQCSDEHYGRSHRPVPDLPCRHHAGLNSANAP